MTSAELQGAVAQAGWRLILGWLATSVATDGLRSSARAATVVTDAAGHDADRVEVDIRVDRVLLRVQPADRSRAGDDEAALALRLTGALAEQGWATVPATAGSAVTGLEVAIDALDIPAVLPFWRAVLGYVDGPVRPGQELPDDLVDPAGVGPNFWFQQMDEPRPQRNRVHFDVTVPHDEAEDRVAAAIAAGGHLVSDAEARAFWILADTEGNEACVCTWQDRG